MAREPVPARVRRTARLPLTLLIALPLLLGARDAGADWLVAPFIGTTFGGRTSAVDAEHAASDTHVMFGGAAAWLSDGIVGVEAEFGYAPRFFEGDIGQVQVVDSSVMTLTGNVILAAPLSLTRESLRPYLTGGLGLLHMGIENVVDIFSVERNLLGMSVGGGAFGLISDRTGVRFDLRHFRSLRREESPLTGLRVTRLSFWRASVGVTLRY